MLQQTRTRGVKVRLEHKRNKIKCSVLSDPSLLGYCRMLVNHGLQHLVKDAPVCLETINEKALNAYNKLGFRV